MTRPLSNKATALLTLGALAGPLYLFVSAAQIALRKGFDPTRHSWSLLSNGDLGWIHIVNFILTGLLTLLGAIGVKMVLNEGIGKTWAPLLLGLYGVSLIGAGIFVADPVNGFPPGTAATSIITTNGLLHLISGSIGFLGLIAACFIFARRFRRLKEKTWSTFSLLTGIIFFAAFFGIASGSQPGNPLLVTVTLAFTAAVILAWTWFTLLCLKLMKVG
jgi:hypothetical protein